MENKKKKKLLVLALASTGLLLAVGTVTFRPDVISLFGDVAQTDMGVALSASNGAAAQDSLKSQFVSAKTNYGNDVQFVLKNCAPAAGKLAKVKAKGYYGNWEPINGATKLNVVSNATVGDAVVKYGFTSDCLDGSYDLATGTGSELNFNYFKIVAKNEIEITSVGVELTCDNSNSGAKVLNASGDDITASAITFVDSSGKYAVKRGSAMSSAVRIDLPDYYTGSSGYQKVYATLNTSSTGCFESNSVLEVVNIPETYTEYGNYNFYTANKVTEFTLGYSLTKVTSYSVPKGSLEVLNIHSKNLASASSIVSSSDHKNLKTVNVSADVEYLPAIISSWPSNVTINYEGTEEEWAALTSAGSSMWKSFTGDVICSDTTVSTVTLSFANATLGSDVGEKTVSMVTGRAFADPGKPVYAENAKKFDGWYIGNDKVVFPYTVNENVTMTAKFVEWPTGSNLDNPTYLADGNSLDFETDADITRYYVAYTATEDSVVMFELSNVTKTGGSGYQSTKVRFYGPDKTEISVSNSRDPDNDTKTIGMISDQEAWKIRFTAGQTYYMGIAVRDDGTAWGTGNIRVEKVTTANFNDYAYAKAYTVGETETCSPGENFMKWYTFSVATTATYLFTNGVNSTARGCAKIGYFDEGAFKTVKTQNASINSKTSNLVELTAGVTYYVVCYSNANGTNTFSVTSEIPETATPATAKLLVMGGEAITVQEVGFNDKYYKVEVAEATAMIMTYTSSGSGKPTISVYKANGTALGDKLTVSSGSVDTEKLVSLPEAGTYYIEFYCTNSFTYTFKVGEQQPGYGFDSAIAVTVDSTTTSLDLQNNFDGGTYYKFVAVSDQFVVLTTTDSANVTLYDSSKANGKTFVNGEMHKKMTTGSTYYLLVKGTVGTTTTIGASLVDTIEDGYTEETAFILTLGVARDWVASGSESSCYAKFTAPEEADYIITRTNSLTTTLYVYDLDNEGASVTVSSGAESSDKIVSLLEGHTYKIYYSTKPYSTAYTHKLSINKKVAGYDVAGAIEFTITAETTTFDLQNFFGGSKTYYKFVAPVTKYYSITNSESASVVAYDETGKTKIDSMNSSGVLLTKFTAGTTYVITVGTVAKTYTFGLEYFDSVKDGKTAATAFDLTGEVTTFESDKASRQYTYFKVAVTRNTNYVCWTISGHDMDFSDVYGMDGTTSITSYSERDNDVSTTDTLAVPVGGNKIALYNKMGATCSSECFTNIKTGENDYIFIKVNSYAIGTFNVDVHFMTAEAFLAL